MKILVVDDNDDIRLLANTVLSMQGFEVTEAVDGTTALAAVRSDQPPDLVLLDIRIPEPSGFEVLETIRAEALPVKVVMFSAHADDETEQEAYARNADGFVVKPFTAAILCDTIDRIMGDVAR